VSKARDQAVFSAQQSGEDAFLLALSDRLRRIDDPLEILREASAAVGTHLCVNRAGYAEVDPEQGTFVVERDWTDGSVAPGTGQRTIASFGSQVTAMLFAGETQTIVDAYDDTRVHEQDLAAFEAMKIVAAITVPLVKNGRLVAMFSVHKSSPRCWSEAEVRLVEQVAERTWAAHARARTGERLRDSESRLAFLLELSDRTRSETDAKVILDATASMLVGHLGAARVSYGEVDEAADLCIVKHAWGDKAASTARSYAMSLFGDQLIAQHRAGITYVAEDASTDPLMSPQGREIAEQVGAKGMITVPLVRSGAICGYLSIHDKLARRWTESEISLVREVAERTWATLVRAHAEEELRRSEAHRSFLLALADRTRLLADPNAILSVTTDLLSEHFQVNSASYSSLDWVSKTVHSSHFQRDSEGITQSTYPISVLGPELLAAHLKGEVFRSEDIASDPRISEYTREVTRAHGVYSIMSAPLVKDDQLVGLLSVSHEVARAWPDQEANLLQEVAERTWANLERATTALLLAEREASTAFLLAIGDRLREQSSATDMLQVAVEAIGQRLGVHRVGYAEIDEASDLLEVNVEWGDGSLPCISGHYPLSAFGSYHLSVLRRGETARISDGQNSPHFDDENREAMLAMGIQAAVTVPLVREGGLVALLSVHHGETRAWTDAEVRLVEEVAERTWAIVERARAEAELARSREALYQSEKLTALGSLLAGLSHEMNNPLSVVVLQSVMMEEDAAGTALGARAKRIREAADRCSKIVATFLAMARQRPPERSAININDVIEGALGLAAYGLRSSGIVIDRQFEVGLPLIEADPDQLHQVFVNLIINAQHALQNVDAERRLSIVTRRSSAFGAVEVEVSDNGSGVPPDVRRRIFEPFFTTKPQGAGTGLGLSFSLGVIEAHGGKLELLARDDGTTFKATLPATVAPARRGTPETAADAGNIKPRAEALVVDDEPEIADSLAELLERDGYKVRIATSGAEAKVRLETRDYDLILSDLRMPDGDGPSLYTWIETERSHLAARIGFVTGDTIEPGAMAFLARAGRPTLEKPFTPAALRAFVAKVSGSAS
jgi:GAF domain-containing protein/CheY-like chemotaxis protein